MGTLTRSFDWSATVLGDPNTWPQSLRTLVGMLLAANSPMFLWWGPDLIQFYNDAYRPSLGNRGKHPGALGQCGQECWPEIWPEIGPLIDQVLTDGLSICREDQLLPIYRNGQLEDVYWSYSYTPVRDESNQVAGILVTCTETTVAVGKRLQLEQREHYLRELTETVPAILWVTQPDGRCTYLNKQWYDYTDQSPQTAEGFGWLDATHPDDRAEAARQFLYANEHQIPFDTHYRLRGKDGQYRWSIDKGSPRFGPTGQYEGMVGTVVNVHEQKLAEEETRKLVAVIDASQEFIGLANPDTTIQYVNPAALAMLGWTSITNKRLADGIYPPDWPLAQQLLKQFMEQGHFSQEIRFVHALTGKPFWLNWNAVAIREATTEAIVGLATVSPNIDRRKRDEQDLRESEAKYRSLIEQAPVATGLFVGRDLRIEQANAPMLRIWGKGNDVLGKRLADALPELKGQPFLEILENLFTTKEPFVGRSTPAVLMIGGQLKTSYFDFTYQPLFDEQGEVYAILDMATDVTEQVLARQKVEESQRQVLDSFEQSPVGITIIKKQDLTFRMANSFYAQLVGRTPDELIGKPMLEAIPELKGQGFDVLLQQVIDTGIPYVATEVAVDLVRNDQLETIYVDMTYQPERSTDPASSTGVLVVAIDVTQQVKARKAIESSEAKLRSVITTAPAAMGLFVGRDLIVDLPNQTFIDIVGKGPDIAGKPLRDVMPELKNQPFLQILDEVYTSGKMYQSFGTQVNIVRQGVMTHDFYNITYTPLLDSEGQVYAILDIAIDVSEQVLAQQQLTQSEERYRTLSAELDLQVQQRTAELEARNNEFIVANEELEQANQNLTRSNKNLEQFAYVASHDLQEPLRKIQQFGDLLNAQYAASIGDGVVYLERMQSAASRMSRLIRDLLSFSRISTQQEHTQFVSLTRVVELVLNDLELTIQESGASIQVDPLPTIPGDKLQLGQLFQNLLTNALKFRRKDSAGSYIPPQIHVSYQQVMALDLPPSVKPLRSAAVYYRINVSDKGIGFAEHYTDRIFQVFQRLHGRNEFSGTGIGLAICQKVVENHNGALVATSQPGQGSTFSIYLPLQAGRDGVPPVVS